MNALINTISILINQWKKNNSFGTYWEIELNLLSLTREVAEYQHWVETDRILFDNKCALELEAIKHSYKHMNHADNAIKIKFSKELVELEGKESTVKKYTKILNGFIRYAEFIKSHNIKDMHEAKRHDTLLSNPKNNV